MYHNRRCAQVCVSDYSIIQNGTTETRHLRVSVLCVDTSQLCLSHAVKIDFDGFVEHNDLMSSLRNGQVCHLTETSRL
jgi:hypothetical protein